MTVYSEGEVQTGSGAAKAPEPELAGRLKQAQFIASRLLFAAIGIGAGLVVGFLAAVFSGLVEIAC
jgi:hypothetical protein